MKESRTNVLTQGLLEAARQDGPAAAQRSRIWEGVALAPQLSVVGAIGAESARTSIAASAKAAGSAVTGGLSVGKLLLVGALAGSALTVGLGVFLMRGPLHERVAVVAPSHGANSGALSGATKDPGVSDTPSRAELPDHPPVALDIDEAPTPAAEARALPPAAQTFAKVARPRHTDAPRDLGAEDPLMREAALVSEARTEVVAGRATSALELLDVAARSSSHSLEPEAMSLRVRALRLLHRDGEADRVEETLKTRYPGSFLSR